MATRTLVDSCILLDIFGKDSTWADWSERRLRDAIDGGGAVVNPIVYAEVSIHFATLEDLDAVLPPEGFLRENLPWEAGFLTGRAYLRYRRSGGTRTSPLPDFYLGAHAAVRGYRLLTRNQKDFRSYFPSVELISPGQSD